MYVKGTVQNIHQETITNGRRGPRVLTSVWIVDHHDREEISAKAPPVLWEVQFLDTASRRWSDAIAQFIDPGQRVIADVSDVIEPVHVDRDSGARTFIKARGIDLADSILEPAKQAAGRH